MKSFVPILLSAILITGCAWTKISSVKDPDFANVKFSKILVFAPFSDLEYRQTTEGKFQNALNQKGVIPVKSLDLFPPTREFSEYGIMNVLDKNGIEGILFVTLADYWTSQTYIPESSSTQGSASLIGNTIYYSGRTQNYGGYFISKPNIAFEMRLYDIQTGRMVWIAKSDTRGNAYADFGVMISSLANETANKLKKDDILSNEQYTKRVLSKTSTTQNEKIQYKPAATRLPKLRAAVPEFNQYTDDEIIAAYRKKYPEYKNATDKEIIKLLERKYGE